MKALIKYELIFRHSSEGIILCNTRGIIELVNPIGIKMFGYNNESELIGARIESLIPNRYREHHQSHRKGFNAKPTTRRMGVGKRLAALRANGEEFPVEISLSHYEEAGEGKIIAFVVDITARIKAEDELNMINSRLEEEVEHRTQELQKQYQLLRSISSHFPNGNIYVLERDFTISWADGQLLRESGLKDSSLTGISYTDRLNEIVRPKVFGLLEKCFEQESFDCELQYEDRFFSLSGVPLNENNEEVDQILLVEMDISSIKHMEIELASNLQKEKELNELKSRFVSMASHEFRTPLSSISSSAALIAKYITGEQQEQRDRHINRIKRSVSSLTDILDNFLSADKLESGLISMRLEDTNLVELMDECCEEIRVVLKIGQTIKQDINLKNQTIRSDQKILKNILLNLLSNASKYSGEGSPIIVRLNDLNSELNLSVQDHGIGIPEKEQELIFNRFFRAENAANIQGTGLGLNIVHKYVSLLNGSISFESSAGKGTIFTIKIPITEQA